MKLASFTSETQQILNQHTYTSDARPKRNAISKEWNFSSYAIVQRKYLIKNINVRKQQLICTYLMTSRIIFQQPYKCFISKTIIGL